MKLDWSILLDNGDIVQCGYKATQKYSLIKLHVDSKHVGKKYGCNECDFKVGYKFYLNFHKRSKHTETK